MPATRRNVATRSTALGKPVEKTVKLKAGEHHYHGCETCGQRYSDACRTPLVNATCSACRGPHGRPLWDRDHDPRDCCRVDPVLCTAEEQIRFRLGGADPWWRCRTCSRTHPYRPRNAPGGAP